jgi:hypothetical protein
MNSDSNASSATIEAQARKLLRWRPGSLKYILTVTILACLFGTAVLTFAFPSLPERLLEIAVVCFLVLFVSSLGALFRRRWRELAIYLVIWPVVLLPLYKSDARHWLYVEAFRVHVSPIEEYLSKCELFEFVQNGTKQRVGRCERESVANEIIRDVFYDTSGQFELPVAQRTPEWKAAMGHFSPHAVLIEKEGRAEKLIGNFYEVIIPSVDWEG